MPREGVFTKVLHGGTISVGDELTVVGEQICPPPKATEA